MALDDKARGQRIAQLRKRRRLTQQAMAERLRIGYRTYQTWEGGTMPEWPNLEKLADFFGVKPEYLIGEEGVPPEAATQLDRMERKLDALLKHFGIELEPETISEAVEGYRQKTSGASEPPASGERRRRDRRAA